MLVWIRYFQKFEDEIGHLREENKSLVESNNRLKADNENLAKKNRVSHFIELCIIEARMYIPYILMRNQENNPTIQEK